MDLDAFVERHSELLELERNEEVEQNAKAQERFTLKELENKGLVIKRVSLDSCCTGLYGRRIFKFRAWKRGATLPANKFASGDIASIVLASDAAREGICSGVVTSITQSVISIAVDNDGDDSLCYDDGRPFHLFKLANDVTFRRLKRTLEKMRKKREIRFSPLIELLFGTTKPTSASEMRDPGNALRYLNENLDASQKEAVKFALSQKEVCIIHGPPGTGKTTTLIEVVLQLVRNGSKVLACAPSNIAVDNLVEKLISYEGSVKVVRLGHPARVLPEIQRHSLDAVLARSDDYIIREDIRKELDSLLSSAKKNSGRNCLSEVGRRRRDLQKELQQRERRSIEMTLRNADVVLSTLTTASDEGPLNCLPQEYFDVAVVDECSQALEAACWMALLRAPKCVLAGDHLQLPPTIVSKRAADGGLSLTLMERLLKLHGNSIMKMLTMQYRMNADIMRWSSDKLYEGKLEAHNSVQHHLLRDMPGVEDNEATSTPLLLIDTAGCGMYELDTVDEDSKGNEGEADLVCIHVENLISSGVKAADIAVISPYNLQVELLRLRLRSKYSDLEIRSVDGFQGREKEAVVMSFVRSNTEGTVGFLAEERRINVAVTRARRHLAIICDSATVSRHPFIESLVDYLMTNGSVQCAREYSADLDRCESLRPSDVKLNQKKVSTKSQKSSHLKKHQKGETTMGAAHKGGRPFQLELKCEDGGQEVNREERVLEEVEEFFASARSVHTFPSTLNSYERRLVHEVAEKFGLLHVSEGDGAERRIILRKQSAQSQVHPRSPRESMPEGSVDTNLTSDGCTGVPNKARQQNAEELNVTSSVSETAEEDPASERIVRNKKEGRRGKAANNTNQDEPGDDFDALIASFVTADNTCAQAQCHEKINTVLLGRGGPCPLCNRGFCFSHALPEVHGCGEAARAAARAAWKKSGTHAPPMKADKKAQVKKALGRKLETLAEKRKKN
ncbi:DNA-binding protein SMUBP-2-like isoform X2 [Ornithodoros turicata]|uniref:DNA-binding protein SMUBP-2-like isoform X2 n=1 Tax=Ornithodoros turicata TaxID=34597 RepID=UPI003138F07B